jgi:hypothetical protein
VSTNAQLSVAKKTPQPWHSYFFGLGNMLGSTTNDENGTPRCEAAKFLPFFASWRETAFSEHLMAFLIRLAYFIFRKCLMSLCGISNLISIASETGYARSETPA